MGILEKLGMTITFVYVQSQAIIKPLKSLNNSPSGALLIRGKL